MIEPTGYTALDLIGFTDRGYYDPSATYVKNDLVHDDNESIWRVLIDDTSGVTPAEGLNYTVFIRNPQDAAKQMIAPVETSPTANAHASGTQIIYHDVLYDVTTAIAAGGALVVYPTSGYNIKPAPLVTSQIQALTNQDNAILYVLGIKNLLPNTATSQVIDGVTFTVNPSGYPKGCVKVNGTASATIDFLVYSETHTNLEVGNYIVSGCPKNGSGSTYCLWVRLVSSGTVVNDAFDYGEGDALTITDASHDIYASIVIYSGTTVNDLVFYPMIRPASIKDDTYVPYNEALTTAITNTQSDIAYINTNSTTASKRYENNEQFILDGILRKATTTILKDATLILNSNYVNADSVTKQLTSISEWKDITNNLSWDGNLNFIAKHVYSRKNEIQFDITIVADNNLIDNLVIVVLPPALVKSWIPCVMLGSASHVTHTDVCEIRTNGYLVYHGNVTTGDEYLVISGRIGVTA